MRLPKDFSSYRALLWIGVIAAPVLGFILPTVANLGDSVVGKMGLTFTIGALLIAVAIYGMQADAAERDKEELLNAITPTPEVAEAVRTADERDAASSNAVEQPEASSPQEGVLNTLRSVTAEGISYISPMEIPLEVLYHVVGFWEQENRTGRWNLSTVRGAGRRLGPGNHGWFILFEHPNTGELLTYKVSKGGRGKTVPTVVEGG